MNIALADVTKPSYDFVTRLECAAAGAMPAAIVKNYGPWLLRLTPGVRSRRANSVLPCAFRNGATRFDAASESRWHDYLDQVRTVYAAYGQPVRFQMSPATAPGTLDDVLAQQGFVKDMPGTVMTASRAAMRAFIKNTHTDHDVRITTSADSHWLAMSLQHGSMSGTDPEAAIALLGRLGNGALFAAAYDGKRPMGIGMGLIRDGWLGLFSLATDPEYRRQGVATAVMHSLARHAFVGSCRGMYLQVSDSNATAKRLYANLGFRHAYSFHYRVPAP